MNVNANASPKEIQFSAIITRADGSIEDLGVVSYYNSNPIKRLMWKIKQFLKLK